MRVVVVPEPVRKLAYKGVGIGDRIDPDVISLEGPDEGFGHTVALGALQGRRSWFQPHSAGKVLRAAGDIATAVVGQPLDGIG